VSFTVRTDRRLVRQDVRSERFVLARLVAPVAARTRERIPVNVAFVLDRSGSMGGEKIQLVKEAVQGALQGLDERDRFSLVFYDDQIDVVVENTPASSEAKKNALQRLRHVDARNTTNLAEGWLKGAEQVALRQREDVLNRCLLLTDGLANVGITSPAELEVHAAELRRRGVATSTFGVGADFDEVLLQAMAVAGGGHFYFVERARQIPDIIASELGEILEVVARDAAIEIRAPDGVMVEPLTVLTKEGHGSNVRILLGDLVSGQELETVLKFDFPRGELGRSVAASFALTDRESALDGPPENLTWEYADQADNEAQTRDREVDRAVATIQAARARQEAVMYNRKHDFGAASSTLATIACQISSYAGEDPQINSIVKELEHERPRFSEPMAAMPLQQAYFKSSVVARARDAMGRARRKPKA
jgi:Ca-activated chloride channel family protein